MSIQNIQIVAAAVLVRNDRVIRHTDELAYLVDSTAVQADGSILVKFSSGDEQTYEPNAAVIVRD